jgi:hypothetical protein
MSHAKAISSGDDFLMGSGCAIEITPVFGNGGMQVYSGLG